MLQSSALLRAPGNLLFLYICNSSSQRFQLQLTTGARLQPLETKDMSTGRDPTQALSPCMDTQQGSATRLELQVGRILPHGIAVRHAQQGRGHAAGGQRQQRRPRAGAASERQRQRGRRAADGRCGRSLCRLQPLGILPRGPDSRQKQNGVRGRTWGTFAVCRKAAMLYERAWPVAAMRCRRLLPSWRMH